MAKLSTVSQAYGDIEGIRLTSKEAIAYGIRSPDDVAKVRCWLRRPETFRRHSSDTVGQECAKKQHRGTRVRTEQEEKELAAPWYMTR